MSIWRDALLGLTGGLVWFAFWNLLSRVVQNAPAGRRRALRYLLPTAMLAGSWIVLLAVSSPQWPTQGIAALAINVPLFLFACADAPALLVANRLLNLTAVAGLDPGYKGLLGSATVWLVWFGIVCFWEWRRDANARVTLGSITRGRFPLN